MADAADTDVLERPKADDTTPVATPDEIKPPAGTTATPRLLTPERIERFGAAADEALRTSGEAQTKIAESAGREADILRHRAETQAPARKEVVSAIDEELRTRREHPPQLPAELPERPKLRYDLHEIMGPPGSNKPMNQWMNQIGVLAAISGRTPQERMLLAVTAFNGMIEGWAKGKQEDFQQRYNEWKDQVETIRDTETRKRQYIQDVLNDAKASTELKSLKLQVLGQEDGDRLLVEAAIQKQWGAIDKGNEEKFTRFERMFRTAESIDKVLNTQRVGALMDDPGIVAAANRFAHGFDATPGAGYRAGTAEREAVGTLAAQIMQREGITDADRLRLFQQNVIGGAVTARAGPSVERAELQRAENLLTTLRPFEEFTKGQLANLTELAKRQSRRFGIPVADALLIHGAAALRDDPDAALFLAQFGPTTNEIERIITTNAATNTLSVYAQKKGEELINKGYSAQTIGDLGQLFANDFARRERTLIQEANRHRVALGLPEEPLPEIPPLPPPGGTAGQTPMNETRPGRGGKTYRKINSGPDSDRNNWEEVR